MKVLDLFSGIGGFSLGLERAGMETIAFCEIDKKCQLVLKKHWPGVPIYDDIKTLTKDRLEKDGIDRPDIICGGFPCQDISVAGKQVGIKGKRSGLWSEYARLIDELKPDYAIIENVANLRSQGLVTVLQDIREIGYDAEWHIIPAWSVDSPQLRERIWILAYPAGWSEQQSRTQRNERGFQTEVLQEGRNKNDIKNKSCFPLLADAVSIGLAEMPKKISEPASVNYTVEKLPGRIHYIRQLGNAVVPQIPELIGRAILKQFKEGL